MSKFTATHKATLEKFLDIREVKSLQQTTLERTDHETLLGKGCTKTEVNNLKSLFDMCLKIGDGKGMSVAKMEKMMTAPAKPADVAATKAATKILTQLLKGMDIKPVKKTAQAKKAVKA